MQILLIDDEPTLFHDILLAYGYSVDIATNGYLALKCIQSKTKRYDLVLLDIKMPVMDGWEILRLIRSNDELENLFIMMLTADNTEESLVAGLRKGADLYLTKPISPQSFIEHVRAVERRLQLSKSTHITLTRNPDAESESGKSFADGILTKRQQEIMKLLSQGLSNRDIAKQLSISEATVKNHLASSFTKMDVKNRTQAMLVYQQLCS